MGTRLRRGQAFIELAAGMLVLALVLTTLFSFTDIITQALEANRFVRFLAGTKAMLLNGNTGVYSSASTSEGVSIDALPAKYIFGANVISIDEEVHIPCMKMIE